VELEFANEAETLAQILDQLDYFQVLKLEQVATPNQIKDAFHRESRLYHPDRFNALPASPLKSNVNRIYKRITEAYVVLREDLTRQKYLADINGPDREQKLRFTPADEQEAREQQKKAQNEQIGTTTKGRQLYSQALREIEQERLDAAVRSLKMALTFEPANQLFKDKAAEVDGALREAARKK
jgi:curved DNA-binding protein CbpA